MLRKTISLNKIPKHLHCWLNKSIFSENWNRKVSLHTSFPHNASSPLSWYWPLSTNPHKHYATELPGVTLPSKQRRCSKQSLVLANAEIALWKLTTYESWSRKANIFSFYFWQLYYLTHVEYTGNLLTYLEFTTYHTFEWEWLWLHIWIPRAFTIYFYHSIDDFLHLFIYTCIFIVKMSPSNLKPIVIVVCLT